jgi:hypothetical protein
MFLNKVTILKKTTLLFTLLCFSTFCRNFPTDYSECTPGVSYLEFNENEGYKNYKWTLYAPSK